jgi:hypothetical protein
MQIIISSSNRHKSPIVPYGVIPPLQPLIAARSPLETPWKKVCAKFKMSGRQLAIAMDRNESSLSRAINSWHGLIHPWYQIKLLKLAKRRGVDLRPDDMFPCLEDI